MATSSTHTGWRYDKENGRLDFYYRGTRVGHITTTGMDLASGLDYTINGVSASGGISNLDEAYDGGGSGSGRTITVDSNAVVFAGDEATQNIFAITNTAGTGALIDLTHTTTSSKDIDGTGSTWSVTGVGGATFTTISGTTLTLSADIDMSASATGTYDIILKDSVADALSIRRAGTDVIVFDTSTPRVTITPATTITGALTASSTITGGGILTISTGGASITGNTTITGDLTVTGTMDWGSSLTVDELILDTDGAALGATVCGLWRDNGGDASFQAIAGKAVKLLIAGTSEMEVGDSATIVNEAGANRDFRVESDNLEYALYVDGAKDSVVIGDNTDISDVDYRLMVGNVAKTLATGQSAALLYVAPTASTTEFTSGTHGYIATAYFAEPNITNAGGGTITTAATVYIADAPTEANSNNAALYIASGALTVLSGAVTLDGGDFLFNNLGADLNFRAESDNLQYALYVDGGKDCVVIGDNTDVSDVDVRLYVGNVAKTLLANQSAAILHVAPTASTTEAPSASTHGYIATAYFAEPNITEGTGDTTVAATVYIADAPTEAETDNDALYIASGDTTMASGSFTIKSGSIVLTSGNLTFTAASDVIIAASTGAALEISDASTKFYAIDTRVTTSAVTTHAFDISDYTLASDSAVVATGLSLAAHTLTYSGSNTVTTQLDTVVIGTRTVAGSAVTVNESNSLLLVAPTESGSITLVATSALRIVNSGGTPTNQYGIYIEDLTVGATLDVGIYIAGADSAAIYVAADPVHLADNVKLGFGTGTGVGAFDASIYYSNADLVIVPNDIGTGLVNIAGGIESSSAAEIIISVDNAAITVGTEGAMRVPFRATTDAAFNDAAGGDIDGCIGVQQDTDNGNLGTFEARVNGSWVSVATAGIEIQGKTLGSRKNPSNKWHDNQIVGEGLVDETICSTCGKKMKVGEPIVLYPNFERTDKNDGTSSLHCVFAHLACAK